MIGPLQVGGHLPLDEGRGVQVDTLLREDELPEQFRVRDDPTDPDSRTEDLRAGAEEDHPTLGVERLERRDRFTRET